MIIRFMLAKFYFCYSKYWKFKIFDRHSSYYFDNNAHLSSILLLLNLSPPTANGVPQHLRVDRFTAFPKRLLCCLHLKLGRSSFFPTTYRHLLTLSHKNSPRNLCYAWDYPPHFICNSVQLKKLMFFYLSQRQHTAMQSPYKIFSHCAINIPVSVLITQIISTQSFSTHSVRVEWKKPRLCLWRTFSKCASTKVTNSTY